MRLEQALKLIQTGRSIIPLNRDKRPDLSLVPSWLKYQNELATEDEVKSWFTRGDRNIGIVTGKISNLTVIDIDTWENQIDYKVFPPTFTVRTGSGGYHLYYHYKDIPAQNIRSEHVDIKNDGGYVVGPFSETDDKVENGVVTKKGGKYEIVHNIPFTDFPDGVYDKPRTTNFDPATIEELHGSGSRNVTMTSVIGKWLSAMPKKLWPSVLDMALTWNKTNCDPPLSEHEVGIIFKSLVARESQKNRKIDLDFQEESTISEVIHLADASDTHAKSLSGEKLETEIPELDKALSGGLQIEHVAVISGYTGEGKSLFAMYITAQMIKAGTPVMWFQFELPPTEFWEKYQALGVTKDMPVYVPKVYKTATMDWVEEMIIIAKEKEVKVVVFDLLDFLQSSDRRKQDKNQEDLEIVTRLKVIASKYKVSIILMAHARKPNVEERPPTIYDVRGSGAITGISNWVLLVYRIKKKKKKHDLLTEDNTIYSSFSLQKNRINGTEITFYGDYQQGVLHIEPNLDRIKLAMDTKDTLSSDLYDPL